MTQAYDHNTEHGAPGAGGVGGFRYASSNTGNDALDAALDSLGAAMAAQTPERAAAAKARAQSAEVARAAYAREQKQRRAKRTPGGIRFTEAFDRAIADARADGMTKSDTARLAAKRTASLLVTNVDGIVIERLAGIFERAGSANARAVGAELAREIAARPGTIGNPLSILEWRVRKRGAA